MKKLNILPLVTDHADELVEQQHELFAAGAIDCVAFSFTLVPEGIPALNKAACTRRFRIFQEKLRPLGIPCGILFQATWGHGWTPDEPTDFQRIVRIAGDRPYTMCPEGEPFREYVFKSVATAASAHPDFMMLDDDTRFITGRHACFCPLHTALYNAKYKKQLTSDELREAVKSDETVAREMDAVLQESMQKYARLIRSAIDSVDKRIHCSFCLCAEDVRHAPEVARILAGEGREMIIRINNGRYLQDTLRTIPEWLHKTAYQVAALPEETTVLCEPDTFPQNRYSTPAAMLKAHLLFSAFEGCRGCKIWVTRMSFFEPESGRAYRKILCDNARMFQFAFDLKPKWHGVCIPLPETPRFNFQPSDFPWHEGWHCVFARMGIPLYFIKKPETVSALAQAQIDELSDEQLKSIFQTSVLLDGGAAEALTRRGMASLCGCEAQSWDLPHVSLEQLADGTKMGAAWLYAKLSPLNENTTVLSTLLHRPYALSDKTDKLTPGTIRSRNAAGRLAITIANHLGGKSFNAFGIFNEIRKRQLIDLLNQLAPLPVWYPEDGELLLKAGTLADGTRLVVIANLSLDCHDKIPLCGPWMDTSTSIQRLQGDGQWKEIPFDRQNGIVAMKSFLPPLDVAVFRV